MINEITPPEALERLKNNEAILIDVREQEEWDDSHIKYATHMPLSRFENEAQNLVNPDNKPIIFQCLMGGRSLKAASFYQETQNPDVEIYNMMGGIKIWTEMNLDGLVKS